VFSVPSWFVVTVSFGIWVLGFNDRNPTLNRPPLPLK
jgi:hypothetical protein